MMQANENANRRIFAISVSALVLASILILTNVSAGLQASLPEHPDLNAPDFTKTKVHSVLVSIPDRKLALLRNGKAVRIYQVAVGKSSTPSPTGEFKIVTRVKNPTYYHKGQVIAAGKSNPVGSRWMGLSAKGYGIHGTNQPESIGKAASTGCIRMSKRDLEELFAILEVGDTVHIRAERDDQIAAVFATELKTGTDAGSVVDALSNSKAVAQVEFEKSSGSGQ
jgi:hypothetical protein